jgi:hypothetical protein
MTKQEELIDCVLGEILFDDFLIVSGGLATEPIQAVIKRHRGLPEHALFYDIVQRTSHPWYPL